MTDLQNLYSAIVSGNLEQAVATTTAALQENQDPKIMVNDYLIKGME